MNAKPVKLINAIAIFALFIFAANILRAQTTYSNYVMSLNPAAYWPLQESVQPPPPDIETNYGSLGSVAVGYYGCTNAQHGLIPSPITPGDTCVNFDGIAGGILAVPTMDHRVSLFAGRPFTIEFWMYQRGSGNFYGLASQTGPIGSAGLNGSNGGANATNAAGYSINQNFAVYRGTGANNAPACYTFHVFNGFGSLGGAEVEDTNAASGEWLTGSPTGYTNSWVYCACVFDGTNCWMYMFSTNLAAAYSGTNAMVYQTPITSEGGQAYFTAPTLLTSASNEPDTWDPLQIGATRGISANQENGYMAEVAIYTNALTFTQITNDYAAGTNGLGTYDATIAANQPYMWWKMNAPKYALPLQTNLFPVVNNYGSMASTLTNFDNATYGANCGDYQPGTIPGVAGPTFAGFGTLTNAVAINGLKGAVDVGYNGVLDGTNNVSYTIVGWLKGNPLDANGRYESPIGHYNNSWTIQFQNGTFETYKGTGSEATIAPSTYNVNDGNWHMFAYVYDSTNTTLYAYLDNGAYSSSAVNSSSFTSAHNEDVFIGVAPASQNPLTDNSFSASAEYFAGSLAHMAFFTNALNLNQIEDLYYAAAPGLNILTNPVSSIVDAGTNASLSVSAIGSQPLSYQWFTNGVAISGATNASLTYTSAVGADSSTNYYVVISNVFGNTVTSAVASLTVAVTPQVLNQFPITYNNVPNTNYMMLYAGASPTYSVSAVGQVPLYYQWFTNGVPAGGATNVSMELTNLSLSTDTVYCVVTNSLNSTTSAVWSASVIALPTNSTGGLAPYPQQVLADNPIAYWRLNDYQVEGDNGNGDDGYIAYDYAGGNDAIYTNVVLGNSGYNPYSDPSDTSVFVGTFANNCDANFVGTNIDFSLPAGNNAEFSVACWVNFTVTNVCGIVTKGYGNGGEEMTIDCDTKGFPRFGMRVANGTFYAVQIPNFVSENAWYHLVAVCDEANSNMLFYVNGQLVAAINTNALYQAGILNDQGENLIIGARSSSLANDQAGDYNNQTVGYINDVAIFNYALTSNQVNQLYLASGSLPSFNQEPVNTEADYGGGTAELSAGVSDATSYQWYDDTGTPIAITGQTNATLVLSNLVNSGTYYVAAINRYGSTNSITVYVTVNQGAPGSFVNPQSPFYGVVGQTTTNYANAYGTWPLYYQWQYSTDDINWTNVSGYRVSGQTNVLTISDVYPSDAGYYQCVVSNIDGASASSSAQLIVLGVPLTFNTIGVNGAGLFWTLNPQDPPPLYSDYLLTLTTTNNGLGQAEGTGVYFYQIPQYIGGFEASFTYEALYSGTQPMADGVTFCIQNDPRGANAYGSGGGELAYGSTSVPPAANTWITNSVALELNIYPGNGVGGMGYSFATDGAIGQTTPPGSVVLTNVPVDVNLYYANGQLSVTFSNEVLGYTYSTNLNVGSIPNIVGTNAAYVGFTGAFGGDTSIQTITNFSFVSIPNEIIAPNGTNMLLTWPESAAGYALEESLSLNPGSANWIMVTNIVTAVNGMNEVIVPKNGPTMFYRLVLLP